MEEIDAWKKRDPIATFADRLLAAASATQVEIDAIATEVDAIVQAAVQFAQDSPWPDPATVADHIFSAGDQSHA
jgi:TPP-dependent pyruvate/acetoin dehydrogenase alpha subunit